MREVGDMRLLGDDFQIIGKRAFPGQRAILTALLFHLLQENRMY